MSTDKREDILVRLLAIAASLVESGTDAPVIKTVWRNKLDISEADQPAIAIMDGDEEPLSEPEALAPGRAVLSHSRQVMRPEIVFITQAPPEDCGSEMNAVRRFFLKNVMADSVLIDLVGDGFIRYEGCRTRIEKSAQVDARMLVMIAFGYILKPSAL